MTNKNLHVGQLYRHLTLAYPVRFHGLRSDGLAMCEMTCYALNDHIVVPVRLLDELPDSEHEEWERWISSIDSNLGEYF